MLYLIRTIVNIITNKVNGIHYFRWKRIKNPNGIGRWTIETCNKKTEHKIDMANQDNCGPCGKYRPPTL
jgi:hypothetical protein